MRITVRGWGRDAGETEVMDAPLSGAEAMPERMTHGKLYKAVDNPEDKRWTKVRILTSAELRLGGTYMLRVELSRKEIAQLFFDTHTGAMVRMIQSFIEEEEREELAQLFAEMQQRRERRRQRLAQAEHAEQTLQTE